MVSSWWNAECLSFQKSLYYIVVWIIGANIFYSVGWILEVYLTYLKERLNLKLDSFLELLAKSRIILFLLGTLASVFWTWVNILSIVGSNTPY